LTLRSQISNLLGNTPLEKAMHDNLLRLGPPPFDDADRIRPQDVRVDWGGRFYRQAG
jgi:hypothetical protein